MAVADTIWVWLTAAFILAFSLKPGFCFYLDSIIKSPMLEEQHQAVCSIRTPCGYSICQLNGSTGGADKSCMFLENSCSCPDDSTCMKTDYLDPGSSVLTFTSYCRSGLSRPGTRTRHSRPTPLDTGKHGQLPSTHTHFGKAVRQDRVRGMQNAIWITLPGKQSMLTSRIMDYVRF